MLRPPSFKNIALYLLLVTSIGGLKEDQKAIHHPVSDLLGAGNFFMVQKREKSFLRYRESFEEGRPFFEQSMQFAGQHSFNVVSDPVISNNKVGRFELRDSDPQVKGSIRAEVGFRAVQKEAWYAYSIYFPTGSYEKDDMPEIISQWHQPKGGSPPNAIQVESDEIYFRTINRSNRKEKCNNVYVNFPIGQVERGKWKEFVFHFIHSPDDDGLIEIWFNGDKMHTLIGPNMQKDFDLPYFKIGIYKWRWDNDGKTQTNQRVLFFDNIVIGNGRASLNDVMSVGK